MNFSTVQHRLRAKEALKGNWGIALLVALIASAPSLLMQVVATRVSSGLLGLAQDLLYARNNSGSVDTAPLLAQLQSALPLLLFALAVAALLTPVLECGQKRYTLSVLRGEDPNVTMVFSRISAFLKAFAVSFCIVLKCLLWSLPGAVLMALTYFLPSSAATGIMLLGFLATVVQLVLIARCYLRHALAPWMLAEDPTQGVRSVLRRSREIMQGKLGQLFSLVFFFYGLLLLLSFVLNYFLYSLPTILSLTIGMAAELAINVYLLTAVGSYYEEQVNGRMTVGSGMVI